MADRLFASTPNDLLADRVEAMSTNGNLGEIDRAILEELAHRLRDSSLSKLSARDQAFASQGG
jgi:hypothetical protein